MRGKAERDEQERGTRTRERRGAYGEVAGM